MRIVGFLWAQHIQTEQFYAGFMIQASLFAGIIKIDMHFLKQNNLTFACY